MSEVRGGGRECQAATAQERLRGAIPGLRSGVSAGKSYPLPKARRWGGEEIPLVQGKEQWLRFAGAAVKRLSHVQGKINPSKAVGVARGHQRADTLKPYSQKTSQSNHTRTTALSNSVKLSHALWGHPRRAGHGGEI